MNINIFNGYQSTVPAVIKFQQMVDIIRGDKQLYITITASPLFYKQ